MGLKLYLIGRVSLDTSAICEFLSGHKTSWRRDPQASPAEAVVEFAGRMCYMSFGAEQSSRSNAEYIRNLVCVGHESVLEHATFTFALSGVSRAFSHQFVRHRIGFSFSQLSQQYVDQEKVDFVEPVDLSSHPELAQHWRQAVESSRTEYKRIRELLEAEGSNGVFGSRKEFLRFVRSTARSLLPNATETRIVFTANARSLRDFLRLRGAILGDIEMRRVSAELLRIMEKEAPALFADFRIEYLADGSPVVKTSPKHRRSL